MYQKTIQIGNIAHKSTQNGRLCTQPKGSLQYNLENYRVNRKKMEKVWKININFLSLQRQNICCDYAAECGE